MPKKKPRVILILAPAAAVAMAGCFQYSPQDLPGYDAAVDQPGDGTDMDVQVDAEGDMRPPDAIDAQDGGDSPGDPVEDEFVPDWDVPATCGNGTVEPPDEDCDGDPDRPCTTGCGTEGVDRCIGCKWVCFPPPDDDCNGVDEDCDTIPDDGYVSTFTCGSGVCERDSTCTDGVEDCAPGDPTGSDADCNGIDEDCSGVADDHYAPPPPCGRGVCQRDYVCTGGVESCTPGSPTGSDNDCNGLDDNCNGSCDENYSTTMTCGTGPCERFYQCTCGAESCTPGTPLSTTDTTCNNVDDDCDGTVDDDYVPTTCGLGVCQRQSTCDSGTVNCTPGDPTGDDANCNGIDENCSGVADENYVPFACGIGACIRYSACTGGVPSCTPGTPAPTEICDNGIDDDCDGSIDEGCGTPCAPCSGSTNVLSINPTGGRFTGTTSGSGSYQGSCGGAGAPEAFYHFTTTQTVDVFIATHGSSFNTAVYVRSCECSGTEVACNNDADGLNTSMLHLRDLAAGTYLIFVDGASAGALGSYQLDVYVTAPSLEGDRCGDPIRLTGTGYSYLDPNSTCNLSGDYTVAVTGSGVGDCDTYVGTGDAEEIVFYFWVPADGTAITFQTCSSSSLPSTIHDSAIYVRSVCNNPGGGYQLGCNDDGCGGSPVTRYLSRLTVTLNRGLYYFMVDGYDQTDPVIHTCGEFILAVTGLP